MLPFNTTIPAVVVAVLGFSAGAYVFSDLLSEPQGPHSIAQQDDQNPRTELRQKPKQATKSPDGTEVKGQKGGNAASSQGPKG